MDLSGVDYCDVFISCLDSHSDGTHSLQSIHCWTSDVMIYFSKSDEKKQTHPYIGWHAAVYIFKTTIPIILWEQMVNKWLLIINMTLQRSTNTALFASY